jgi:hypothetical protein
MSIIDKIQTLADAYTYSGLEREETIIIEPKNKHQKAANSFIDALTLTAALNEGRKPNFDDSDEVRYIIGWDMRSEAVGGPGFAYDVSSTRVRSVSPVCIGLIFFNLEVAKYAATTFPEVYEPFMVFHQKDEN